jgi:hypothetical protein
VREAIQKAGGDSMDMNMTIRYVDGALQGESLGWVFG